MFLHGPLFSARFEEALAEATTARALSPTNTHSLAYIVWANAHLGRSADARAAMDEMLGLARERFVPPYHLGLAWNGFSDPDRALDALEAAFEERDPKMVFLNVEQKWDNLRTRSRFRRLIEKMKFPKPK